jgi:hypothetical protein
MRSFVVGIVVAGALAVGGAAALASSTSPLPPNAKACDNAVAKVMNPHCTGKKPGNGGGGGNPGHGHGNGNGNGGNNHNNNNNSQSQSQQQSQSQSQRQCILVLGLLQPANC